LIQVTAFNAMDEETARDLFPQLGALYSKLLAFDPDVCDAPIDAACMALSFL
jgi:hypothetical protein